MPNVSEPATVAEAAEVLRGGGRVSIDCDGGDVVLSTRRLNRLLEYEPGDLTAIVEAGMRLSELQAHLAPQGQMLALDPPGDPTVGACLAGDLSGPRRHRYGAMRDLVIGVTVVLADGTVASSGGKVVKNVAGYDLGKLVCGSEGRLGLIARVSLRLHPLPAALATLVVETGEAAEIVRVLRRSQLQPSALDVLHPGRVAVLFEGRAAAVEAQVENARALVGGEVADDAVWDEARARQGASLGRARFAPGDLANVLSTLDEAVVRPAAGIAYVPHRVGGVPSAEARRVERALRRELDPTGVLE